MGLGSLSQYSGEAYALNARFHAGAAGMAAQFFGGARVNGQLAEANRQFRAMDAQLDAIESGGRMVTPRTMPQAPASRTTPRTMPGS